MASDAAPREGESRLHELLEKTVEAVTRLNDSIVGFSAQSHGQDRHPTQVELRKHDQHAALSSEEPPNTMAMGRSGRVTTSNCISNPASSHFNEMPETNSREAEVAPQDEDVIGSEYGVSDADDVMFELVTFTSELEISSITGVDLKDDTGVILDLNQIPEVVCDLALQVLVSATANKEDFTWFSTRDACVVWHPKSDDEAGNLKLAEGPEGDLTMAGWQSSDLDFGAPVEQTKEPNFQLK
ncbi:hypothetical protein KC333_g545 [Hortaea werneckii]|nr:hypothetical protein KC333_g545 [Hortaea werneckii]